MLHPLDTERCCAARLASCSSRGTSHESLEACYRACRTRRSSRATKLRTRAFLVSPESKSDSNSSEEHTKRLLDASAGERSHLRLRDIQPSFTGEHTKGHQDTRCWYVLVVEGSYGDTPSLVALSDLHAALSLLDAFSNTTNHVINSPAEGPRTAGRGGFGPRSSWPVTSSLLLSLGGLEFLSAMLPPASRAAESVSVEAFGHFLVRQGRHLQTGSAKHVCPLHQLHISLKVPVLQDSIESLGPLAPVAFVGTVVAAEMIPLFPTQPLSIASGLLFGTPKVRAAFRHANAALTSQQLLKRP